MKVILDNTALVRGVVISIYTLYQIVSSVIVNQLTRIAMGEKFRLKFMNYFVLIYVLSDMGTK